MAVILTAPTPALAASAFDILVPKPAEFIPALVAFIVIWVILAKLVWPTVLKTLDARQQTIQNNLDAAEQAKVEAAEALKKAEAAVDEAQIQADDIVAEAKKTAEASRAAIIEKANADAKQITDRARENIDAERNAAMAELVDQAADLAVDLASKIIGEHLDVETQKRLIEKSLAEAGDANVDE
ncbi:F0F1 ATP synthase subunit B [Leptogranulimonas caecicola]|uniref:F0F1 ATP synthase subunit B n=1 Tax=Coriobacteriales TaxID=84999 RepID=UPI002240F3B2|nr:MULTISPECIES: F0F1 ATP synthase subunit B [Atopobiaceae]